MAPTQKTMIKEVSMVKMLTIWKKTGLEECDKVFELQDKGLERMGKIYISQE